MAVKRHFARQNFAPPLTGDCQDDGGQAVIAKFITELPAMIVIETGIERQNVWIKI